MGSLVFVVIIGVWLAFLVPHWVRRRTEIAAARSLESVVGGSAVDARLVDRSTADARRRLRRGPSTAPLLRRSRQGPDVAAPPAARTRHGAASRRRRVLGLLSVVALAGDVPAGLGVLPVWGWAACLPLAVFAAAVVAGARRRRAARRRSTRAAVAPQAAPAATARSSASAPAAPAAAALDLPASPDVPASPIPPHAPLDVEIAIEADTIPAGDGWTPVPVPRPTYTMKARAPRTAVRPYADPEPEIDVDAEPDKAAALVGRRVAGR